MTSTRRDGLLLGYGVDLCEAKPCGGAWNLSQKQDVERPREANRDGRAFLPAGGLHAKHSQEKGERHLHACVRMYHKQIDAGRHFLHEHSWSADLWYDPEVKILSGREGVYLVKGPTCKWEMQAEELQGLQGKGYVRKKTGWLANSAALAERLAEQCGNATGVWLRCPSRRWKSKRCRSVPA